MSYAVSSALQAAVYQRLTADAGLTALVGSAIFDAIPAGPVPDTYVSLGPESATDRSDQTGRAAIHDFVISVVSERAGFQDAKEIAAAIGDALSQSGLVLARGRVVALNFRKARARREGAGDVRRIDMTFRAFVEDN